jgi:hypothetical protein
VGIWQDRLAIPPGPKPDTEQDSGRFPVLRMAFWALFDRLSNMLAVACWRHLFVCLLQEPISGDCGGRPITGSFSWCLQGQPGAWIALGWAADGGGIFIDGQAENSLAIFPRSTGPFERFLVWKKLFSQADFWL